MAKLSKAEEDRLRREGSGGNKKFLWIGLAIVAIVVILVVANTGGQAGNTKAENLEAFGLAEDPYLGDPNAPVVVVGFEAPTCSACRGFHAQFLPGLKADYFETGKAVFYYSQYHIGTDADFHIGTMQECALEHGGRDDFWNFTDMVYLELGQYPSTGEGRAKFNQFAAGHPSEADLLRCADDAELGGRVSQDYRVGRDWEVTGTPTFYIFGLEGEPARVSMSQIGQAIDELQP